MINKVLKKLLFTIFLFPLMPIIHVEGEETGTNESNDTQDNINDGKNENENNENENNDNDKKDDKNTQATQIVFKDQDAFNKTLQSRINKAIKQERQRIEQERQKENMSAEEKAAAAAREAQEKAEQRIYSANQKLIKAEVYNVSANLGVIDADAVYRLIDKELIDVDDDGNVNGIEQAIKTLISEKKYLVKSQDIHKKVGDEQSKGNENPSSQKTHNEINKAIRAYWGY